jgi:hypothetical protein
MPAAMPLASDSEFRRGYAVGVRILRLSNSDDLREAGDVPERAYRYVEAALAAETGEPVETIVRDAWPEPNLPDVVDSWLRRYSPDIVFLKVSSYWFTYRSTPLKLQRGRPRALQGAGRAAADFAGRSSIADTAAFHAFRNTTRRVFGGATYFTPGQVVDVVSSVIRRVSQHEDILLVVRGGLMAETLGCSKAVQRRAEADRQEVDRALARLCGEVHVHYTGCREAPTLELALPYRGRDRLHVNAAGHERVGMEEAKAMLAAWRNAHGQPQALYLESDAVC